MNHSIKKITKLLLFTAFCVTTANFAHSDAITNYYSASQRDSLGQLMSTFKRVIEAQKIQFEGFGAPVKAMQSHPYGENFYDVWYIENEKYACEIQMDRYSTTDVQAARCLLK